MYNVTQAPAVVQQDGKITIWKINKFYWKKLVLIGVGLLEIFQCNLFLILILHAHYLDIQIRRKLFLNIFKSFPLSNILGLINEVDVTQKERN